MPIIHRLDQEYAAVLGRMPLVDLTDLPAARIAIAAMLAAAGTPLPHPAVTRSDHLAPGLPGEPEVALRIFKPAGATAPLPWLFWIHGGGYVLPAAAANDEWCDTIAHDLHCAVVRAAWRAAPEAPFPGAHADCYAGLLWAAANAAALGLDPARLVVGGASSGGGAAAGVVLRARDESAVRIAHQLLIYPMLDDRQTSRSSHLVTDPEVWNRQKNGIAWRAYLGEAHGTDAVSPYAAPARAESVAGLPPTTILTAELDLFVDENIEYAQRLLAAEVPTELHVYPAVPHGFQHFNPAAATSRRFYADRDNALARAFALTPAATAA